MSNSFRSSKVVVDENLTARYQTATVKKKAISGLTNKGKKSEFIDWDAMSKLVYC